MSARAEDAARALSREQPTTADAAVPAPANNGSADAEGVEIPAPEPSGNKNLLQLDVGSFSKSLKVPFASRMSELEIWRDGSSQGGKPAKRRSRFRGGP